MTPTESKKYNRNNRYLTIDNETKTLTEWSKIYKVNINTIRYRLNNGWTTREIVFGRK